MKKILFILHTPPPIHGSSVVGGLIKDSWIINKSFECRYINLGTSDSIEEIGHNVTGKISRYISLVWNVKKQLFLFKPHLCYFTPNSKGIGFYKDAVIILLVRLFGIRVVYHFHNKGVVSRQNKFFDNLLYRLVFRNAQVILLSKNLYTDVSKYVSANKVHYCLNGIPDINAATVDHNIQHKEECDRTKIVNILFVSHLIESKGVFILIAACKILKDHQLDFHCVMIGGEGDVSITHLKSIVDNAGLSEIVLIAGKKFSSEKVDLFEQADIFVHPSFNDCLPLVLLEAMQYSLPVVSTLEGAIPEIVEDGVTGLLVPKKDSTALAEKLEILIKDSELREQMGKDGRMKYEEKFTLPIFENHLKEILQKI